MKNPEEMSAEVPETASHMDKTSNCSPVFDYCSFEQELNSKQMNRANLTKIRRHSADLIRKIAERIGHI